MTQGSPTATGGGATADGGNGGSADSGNTQVLDGNAIALTLPSWVTDQSNGSYDSSGCSCSGSDQSGGQDNGTSAQGGDTTATSGDAIGGNGGDAGATGGDATAGNLATVVQSLTSMVASH